MDFARLAHFFDRLEGTTKRLEMTGILVEMLEELEPSDVDPATRLLQGKVRPDWEGIELGLAEKMVLRALAAAGNLAAKVDDGVKVATVIYHDVGDLGKAAEEVASRMQQSRQMTLIEPEPLAVQTVYDRLLDVAQASGAGSQDAKQTLLIKLLREAGPLEARYIIRIVAGRLRLGVADMTFLDALAAWRLGRGVRSVQDMPEDERAEHEETRRRIEAAYDRCSDLARVAVAVQDGMAAVARVQIEHGVPLRPMAAERLKTVGEILEKHGGRSAVEYKYDGLRLQCHVSKEGVRLFSRRMEELTDQFPDVQALLQDALTADSCIVEGECVAIDGDGRMRPFQELSRRRGRKRGLGDDRISSEVELADDEAKRVTVDRARGGKVGAQLARIEDEVGVAVYLFDCLSVDGASVMDDAYAERRERIGACLRLGGKVERSLMEVCEDEAQAEAFFQAAVQDGAEGIMCKDLSAPYKAGNRGFAWIKYKTDYTEDLVDTMDLVAIGAFFGRGRRAGWYGALLMAARDGDGFASVCKLGTGFDDETLKGLKDKFAQHVVEARPSEVKADMKPDVWFRPQVVMEVQAAELTLSPIHKAAWGRLREGAGLAARFPRFTRWRDDKGPQQATDIDELVSMYEAQGAQQDRAGQQNPSQRG